MNFLLPSRAAFCHAYGMFGSRLPGEAWNRRRWQLFCAVFLLAYVGSFAYESLRPPVYRAKALVQVTHGALAWPPEKVKLSDNARTDSPDIQALRSRLLLQEVLARLVAARFELAELGEDPVASLQKMLRIETVAGTNVVELSVEGGRPELIFVLLNTLIDTYRTHALTDRQIVLPTAAAEAQDEARRAAITTGSARQQPDLLHVSDDGPAKGLKDLPGFMPAQSKAPDPSAAGGRPRIQPLVIASPTLEALVQSRQYQPAGYGGAKPDNTEAQGDEREISFDNGKDGESSLVASMLVLQSVELPQKPANGSAGASGLAGAVVLAWLVTWLVCSSQRKVLSRQIIVRVNACGREPRRFFHRRT